MEKTPVDVPVPIDIPDEITLAQLVTYYILPAGGDWDVGTIFYWCLEEIEEHGKRTLVEILLRIPIGFILKVKANTLRDASSKRMAKCIWESAPMCFMIEPDARVECLKRRAISWMEQRDQGV
jgi:hypothetical protein